MNDTTADDGTFLSLLPDLAAGRFLAKIDTALREAALATVANGDKGKAGSVTLAFKMERIGETNQVRFTHAIEFSKPTARGKVAETDSTETPLHVGRTGKLTLMPDTQMRFDLPTRDGEG